MSAPSSIEDVVQLVKALYRPGTPAQISSIQETLQNVQRSAEGWQVADALLENEDPKVRFFGALTFTVKLNSDWQSLQGDEPLSLLQRMLSWLCRLTVQGEGDLVLRKICSSLVTFFLKFPSYWKTCVKHVLACLKHGSVISNSTDASTTIENITTPESVRITSVASLFSLILAEEAGKLSANNLEQHAFREVMAQNMPDVVIVITQCMTCARNDELELVSLVEEGIKCFHSWVFYAQRAFDKSPDCVRLLQEITPRIILSIDKEETSDAALETIIDVLSNNSTFIRREDMQSLSSVITSAWASERLSHLYFGDFEPECVELGRLALAMGEASIERLYREPNTLDSCRLFSILHRLLSCKGYPVAEDQICALAMEFWIAFLEYASDSLFDEPEPESSNFLSAKHHITEAIKECWSKVAMHPPETLDSWESETKDTLRDFRSDVGEFLLSSQRVTSNFVLVTAVRSGSDAIERHDWDGFEASLFALNALKEGIQDNGDADRLLTQILSSDTFLVLGNPELVIPKRTKQSAVNLLSSYARFFERNHNFLPSALNYLFSALSDEPLAPSASRAIASLCSSCRKALRPELSQFMQYFQRLSHSGPKDALVRERIIGAIAAIVQSLQDPEDQILPLRKLLELVRIDIATCCQELSDGELEKGKDLGINAMKCMISIAKSLREAEDSVIDLESEDPIPTFWQSSPGASIQNEVVSMVEEVVTRLNGDGDIIEQAVRLFRAGLSEQSGPFAFPPALMTNFVVQSTPDTPRLGLILSLAFSLIASHSTTSSSRIDDDAARILMHVSRLMQNETYDPEIMQSCVDILGQLLPRYANVLLGFHSENDLKVMLEETLHCLESTEILSKRSSANFWEANIVSLRDLDTSLQSRVDAVITTLGPSLSRVLVFQIGGNASRSELDDLAGPLRKLVTRRPASKDWLEAGLLDPEFPSDKVSVTYKRVFLQKVMSLRGSRGTNQVVKEFWLACRGSAFAYAS